MKDLYFETQAHGSFAILDFPKLKTPLQYVHDHIVGCGGQPQSKHNKNREGTSSSNEITDFDEIQRHFMSHTTEMIGTSLSILPTSVPLNAALACFKVVLSVTTVPFSTAHAAKQLVPAVTRAINTVIRYPDLRDELYLQVIKQLNDNPRRDLTRQSWRLLDVLLEFVPPSTDFENFLESFVRSMGADDLRLFRLYNILSTRIIGSETSAVEYATEAKVGQVFRRIFKV